MLSSDEIRELLEEVKEKKLLVIVEGIRDKRALGKLGVTNVVSLKKPLFAVVEEIAHKEKEIVILTDLDDEGKKLYHSLSRDFQRHGVKINNKLREALFRTRLVHIEGLDTYLD